ncbi:pentatricopeptide repeat-containing protein MRL1, chloroplastic isoform X2 [Juglans regia]|uniref:Pentatricopeptide repeat-containing protein MRL1, chloroplastic isoform X2 n=1 Tax=Juglans regia TaxID=51240 RepID=A0A2I4GBY0_JUGRE|nr:pentatricopeptide repeat-containing protein MRL1, chloroplastic isoform X2 [Juglans regia]
MFADSENVDGNVPVATYKEGLPYRRRDSGKGNGFPRDRKIRNLNKKIYQSLPLLAHPNGMIRNLNKKNYQSFHQFPHPNGMQVTDGKHPSEQLSAYNRLLRAGRLTECVELLEDMERNSLLDMNKVYHAKFFEKCKSQKAVNEAFRYTKLIPNPTLSTFNMLMSVCGSSQDSEGAFQVLRLVQEARFKVDCKLYTTLISTCAKSGKVDLMFEVFHEMVNAGVEPNVHTYGALIDGCARAGQVAKAFGAYGIMRSKNVKPDRVVFNALITACGQSGAVDRAFDVLAEMGAETQPIDPDHITIGALIRACANAGQVDRAQEVYEMIHQYNIKGTPEVYTIAVNCCSGDWGFACRVYDDMTRKGVVPDEMFLSVLIDAAGHAGKLDAAFEILENARDQGINIGIVSYSSLMGACSKAKNWQKALDLYEDLKSMKMRQTVSTVNALITALCDGDQLQKAMEVLSDMKGLGLSPNCITYSILLVASEKKDDLDAGLMLLSQAKRDRISLNLVMCRCIIGMCLRGFVKACTLGEPVVSFDSGRPQVDNKWTSVALMVYRDAMVAGVMPTMEVLSQVLGCLHLPYDVSLQDKLIENLGVSADISRCSNLYSLIDGFGEYDPRAFSVVEEAASLGIVPCVSLKSIPVVVDVRNLQIHTAEVYLLTVLKGLKHRLAAGAKLPNVTILLPLEKTQLLSPKGGDKTINLAGRVSQAVAALLRRLGLQYQGNESYGKIRINGLVLRRWFQPKLHVSPFMGKPGDWSSSQSRLGKGITHQQRDIRTGNLSSE